ncbi:phosphoribosylglycinamide formyltransferase [Faecalitalea cylindroides]|uniref:Phosphoribosylglycinamide formyltransferase n=1 Tax=Faecalitalea cylindroides TaxID=39483 RepID=A0A1Y4LZE7_9FIRM|nr:phosphoribosylglycinamide formyltransferase [Faecalitalea cylindroides]OUP61964.1 phosphoribosylglycinamide formyltransferase [Faecalitalea cylindroides]
MLRLAVLVSGGGTDLQSIIDEHKKGNINCEIALVISNRKSAYGLERAKQAGIPTACIKDQKELLKKLQDEKIDFIVLAGYLAILQEDLIKAYPNKIINIHPSLIPSFCGPGMYGLHVHEAALDKGVKVSGATVHFVSEEVDGGPIIYQEAVSIADLDTAEAIQKRVLEIEHKILPMVVRYYCEDRIRIEKGRVHIL